jgi:hypothetical protein
MAEIHHVGLPLPSATELLITAKLLAIFLRDILEKPSIVQWGQREPLAWR